MHFMEPGFQRFRIHIFLFNYFFFTFYHSSSLTSFNLLYISSNLFEIFFFKILFFVFSTFYLAFQRLLFYIDTYGITTLSFYSFFSFITQCSSKKTAPQFSVPSSLPSPLHHFIAVLWTTSLCSGAAIQDPPTTTFNTVGQF